MTRAARLLLAVAVAAATLVLTAGPASAQFECKTPPVPEVPGRAGTTSDMFLPPPDPLPPAENPFREGARSSIYEQYGMAGFTFTTYDLGCRPDPQWAAAPVMTSLANIGMSVAKFGIGLTGGLVNVAVAPDWLGVFDRVIATGTTALWEAITQPFAFVMLPLLGLLLLWRAHRIRWGQALGVAGFALLALIVAAGIVNYPTESASIADETLSSTVASVNATVLGSDGDPANSAVAASVDTVLWPRWVAGVLGDPNSATAKRYAPDLYRASAMSWREAAIAEADPAAGQRIVEAKNELWTRTAEKIQTEDPDAYEYLIGHRGDARLWEGVLATLSMLCSQPFLAVSALLVIGSYLALRLVVMFFPAIAVFGLLPRTQHIVKAAGSIAIAALINTIVFGVGAAVTMLGIRFLLEPSNGLPGWLGLLLMAMWSFVMWKVLSPFRRLGSLVRNPDPGRAVMDAGRSTGRHAKSAATSTAQHVKTETAAAGAGAGRKAAAAVAAVKAHRAESYSAPVPEPPMPDPPEPPMPEPPPIVDPQPAPRPEVDADDVPVLEPAKVKQ